jgi:hypothetical protein
MIHDARSPEPEKPADSAERTLAAILASASAETRATIAVLGEILGQRPSAALSPAAFAAEHLGVDTTQLATTSYSGPGASLSILGNLLRIEMEKHAERVVVGSPGDGLPPTWAQLELGPDDRVSVPGRLIVFFPAGTLAPAALCVLIDDRNWTRDFAVLSAAHAKPVAAAMSGLTKVSYLEIASPRSIGSATAFSRSIVAQSVCHRRPLSSVRKSSRTRGSGRVPRLSNVARSEAVSSTPSKSRLADRTTTSSRSFMRCRIAGNFESSVSIFSARTGPGS